MAPISRLSDDCSRMVILRLDARRAMACSSQYDSDDEDVQGSAYCCQAGDTASYNDDIELLAHFDSTSA